MKSSPKKEKIYINNLKEVEEEVFSDLKSVGQLMLVEWFHGGLAKLSQRGFTDELSSHLLLNISANIISRCLINLYKDCEHEEMRKKTLEFIKGVMDDEIERKKGED